MKFVTISQIAEKRILLNDTLDSYSFNRNFLKYIQMIQHIIVEKEAQDILSDRWSVSPHTMRHLQTLNFYYIGQSFLNMKYSSRRLIDMFLTNTALDGGRNLLFLIDSYLFFNNYNYLHMIEDKEVFFRYMMHDKEGKLIGKHEQALYNHNVKQIASFDNNFYNGNNKKMYLTNFSRNSITLPYHNLQHRKNILEEQPDNMVYKSKLEEALAQVDFYNLLLTNNDSINVFPDLINQFEQTLSLTNISSRRNSDSNAFFHKVSLYNEDGAFRNFKILFEPNNISNLYVPNMSYLPDIKE